MQRAISWWAGVLIVILVAGACSSTDEPSDGASAVSQSTTSSASTTSGASTVGALVAEELVARLGSDDAAIDALLRALDGGYSADQVFSALDVLQPDGVIPGSEPDGFALGRIGEAGDEGAARSSVNSGELTLVRFQTSDRAPIEVARAHAKQAGAGLGLSGTALVLMMIEQGFSAIDIIEAMVFGISAIDSEADLRSTCVSYTVVDELFKACDGRAWREPANDVPETNSNESASPPVALDAPSSPAASDPESENETIERWCSQWQRWNDTFRAYVERIADAASSDTVDSAPIYAEGRAALHEIMDTAVQSALPEPIRADVALIERSNPEWGSSGGLGADVEEAIFRVVNFGVSDCNIANLFEE